MLHDPDRMTALLDRLIPRDRLYKGYDPKINRYLGDSRHDSVVPEDKGRCPAIASDARRFAYNGYIQQCQKKRSSREDGLCKIHVKALNKLIERT